MENVIPIPSTIKEFVHHYPDEARRIACRKCIGEYNQIREEMQNQYNISIVLWMDINGIVAKTKEILYYMNEIDYESVNL